MYYDYIEEVGHEIERNSHPLHLVVKSSGFACCSIIRNLCLYDIAFNIDIKGNDEDYETICGGSLDPVLDSIELIHEMKCHLEISYLVLESRVKDLAFHREVRDFLASLSNKIPVHLLYCYPFHKMPSSYEPSELLRLHELFSVKMQYVYISNVYEKEMVKHRNTYCSKCKSLLIERVDTPKIIKMECCNKRLPVCV